MAIIKWRITREDHDLMVKVAERALRELTDYPDDKRALVMDLNACHSNACPLDFKGLLEAPLLDFSHDIRGIRRHIDRDTGLLTDFFMPRYALANHVTSGSVMAENNYCNGNGPHAPGECRIMPTGGGGNDILCRACWSRALEYRRERNTSILHPVATPFDLPSWESAKVYEESVAK